MDDRVNEEASFEEVRVDGSAAAASLASPDQLRALPPLRSSEALRQPTSSAT